MSTPAQSNCRPRNGTLKGAAVNGKPRTDLGEFLRDDVYPRLNAEAIFGDCDWQKEKNKWRGDCPWHKSKSGTALYLDPATFVWRCPACGIGGGPVQWLYKMAGGTGSPRGKAFVDIVRKLADLAGVQMPEWEQTPEQQEVSRKRETRQAILEAIAIRAEEVLWSATGEQARNYLHERGLTDDDIRTLQLGLYDSAEQMRRVLGARGFTTADIADSSVVWAGMDGYVIFPWLDDAGRPLTIYGRWPAKQPPDRKPKTVAAPNPKNADGSPWEATKRSPLYLDRVIAAGHEDGVLVEGVIDAAVAHVKGDNRVFACVGAELSRLQAETLARRGFQSVAIALDPDVAGDNGILSCIRSLLAVGIAPFVAPELPDGMDPDEFILARGIDAWREHIDDAVHGLRHIAQQLIQKHQPADDEWTDPALHRLMTEARKYAASVPERWAEQVGNYFWRAIELCTGLTRLTDIVTGSRPEQAEVVPGDVTAEQVPLLVDADRDELPQIISMRELITSYPRMRPEVIEGLLRLGETMNLIASPKLGKSWLVLSLVYAIVTGTPWLGLFAVAQGDVLVIDNELHCETLAARLRRIAEALNVPVEQVQDRVHLLPLRGKLRSIVGIGSVLRSLQPGRFKLIIIDAMYRAMPAGMDENDNGGMAGIYNLIDQYADQVQSSFALIHHTTKGAQSGKSITDVGAGAGSQSRATDTHAILRPHEEDGVFVLDAAVRSFPPVKPVCLRWEWPLFRVAEGLDPTLLRDAPKRRKLKGEGEEATPAKTEEPWTAQRLANALGRPEPRPRAAVLEDARLLGLSDRKAEQLLNRAVECGMLHKWIDGVPVISTEKPPEKAQVSRGKFRRKAKGGKN